MNINKTFHSKRKFNFNLILALVYLALPAMGDDYSRYSSITYYLPLIVVEALLLAHMFGKKITLSDTGITQLIFWKLPYWSVNWQNLEEMSILPAGNKQQSGMVGAMEPFAVLRWIAGVNAGGFRIKMIVTHSEAVYLNLSAIKGGDELYDLLKTKAAVVRG